MSPATPRRSFEAAALLAVLALAALAASGGAHAAVVVGASEPSARVAPGAPGEAEATVPFRLARDGLVYLKVLPTPWNPVNPGTPNGTVAADHSRGLAGWWVEFSLTPAGGAERGLGAYVDTTPTPMTALRAGAEHVLHLRVRVPPGGAAEGMAYRVPVALAYRDPAQGPDSGGSLDPSRGITLHVLVDGPARTPPVSPPVQTPPGGSPQAPAPPPPTSGAAGGAVWGLVVEPPFPLPIVAGLLVLAAAGIYAWRRRDEGDGDTPRGPAPPP